MGWRVPLHASQAAMPGCEWFQSYGPYFGQTSDGVCPAVLMIWLDRAQVQAISTPSTNRTDMAFVFNGGTKTGFWKCGSLGAGSCGSDPYGAIAATGCGSQGGYQLIVVDVWAARRANAWSSSVTIDVYAATEPAGTIDLCASIGLIGASVPVPSATGYLVKKSITTELAALACPTVVKATITVNEDGSVSIA